MQLTVAHDFLPKTPSTRASIVMDHFGIDLETGRHVVAENIALPIRPGDVVLFTGASGSGKSSLMRAAAAELVAADPHASSVTDVEHLDLGERLLIDSLPLPVTKSMQLLSACGLGEPHLMLRTPVELSDGQRYRFRLALGLARSPHWLLADEFSATLDRIAARVISLNVRRLADRSDTGFLLATTHEDVAEELSPDVHIRCRLDGQIDVVSAPDGDAVESGNREPLKKKEPSASSRTSASQQAPKPTGRTSLGGITEATTSAAHDT